MDIEQVEQEIVSAPPVIVNGRNAVTGKFAKGNKLGGGTPSPKRAARIDAKVTLEAICNEFSPDEISVMLRRAWTAADKSDDAKMMLEVVRFIANYAIGKPVQRVIKAQIEPEEFARLFRGGAEEEDFVDHAE